MKMVVLLTAALELVLADNASMQMKQCAMKNGWDRSNVWDRYLDI